MFKRVAIAIVATIFSTEGVEAVQMKAEQRAQMDQQVEQYLNAESGS